MGNEQASDRRPILKPIDKNKLDIIVKQIFFTAQLNRDRRRGVQLSKEKELRALFQEPAVKRNRDNEYQKAASIVNDIKWVKALDTLMRYADIIKDNEMVIQLSKNDASKIQDLLPYIESLIWGCNKTNLSIDAFNQFIIDSYGLDVHGALCIGSKVTPDLKKCFDSILPSERETKLYLVDFCRQHGISLETLNEGGHNISLDQLAEPEPQSQPQPNYPGQPTHGDQPPYPGIPGPNGPGGYPGGPGNQYNNGPYPPTNQPQGGYPGSQGGQPQGGYGSFPQGGYTGYPQGGQGGYPGVQGGYPHGAPSGYPGPQGGQGSQGGYPGVQGGYPHGAPSGYPGTQGGQSGYPGSQGGQSGYPGSQGGQSGYPGPQGPQGGQGGFGQGGYSQGSQGGYGGGYPHGGQTNPTSPPFSQNQSFQAPPQPVTQTSAPSQPTINQGPTNNAYSKQPSNTNVAPANNAYDDSGAYPTFMKFNDGPSTGKAGGDPLDELDARLRNIKNGL